MTTKPEPDPPIDHEPAGLSQAERAAYTSARLQGLCHSGALEAALGRRDSPSTPGQAQ